jgi:hypothetical protein
LAPAQVSAPLQVTLVSSALLETSVPHACTPPQPMVQLSTLAVHWTWWHDWPPLQSMSQLLALHTTGVVEQAVWPEHVTPHELPAQLTPLVQLFSAQLIWQELASVQSTP